MNEVLFVLAAFVLGGLLGPLIWIWLKGKFWAEATAIENKITGHTGPTGA